MTLKTIYRTCQYYMFAVYNHSLMMQIVLHKMCVLSILSQSNLILKTFHSFQKNIFQFPHKFKFFYWKTLETIGVREGKKNSP